MESSEIIKVADPLVGGPSEEKWLIVMQSSRFIVENLLFSCNIVCPSLGDIHLYPSKSRRIPGGWSLKVAEESPPAASGSRLPLGTVRCSC